MYTVTWLMNSMVRLEIIPKFYKKGLIVPIPKANKDHTIKDNNRGITLLPVLYKLFERIMIKREKQWLSRNDVTDGIQSAGQDKCSSLHTSFLVQESIAYHVNKGNSVYAAFLDTKKAFDTVWIDGLLFKLLKAGMSPKIWRLIKSGYTDFKCAAYINGRAGEWFTAERGVHQGAPLSMRLYLVYINDLIRQLRQSGYGLQIYGINAASPVHADDLALLALYKPCINKVLDMSLRYSRKWRYQFNCSKTVYMMWGKDNHPFMKIEMGGEPLKLVQSSKHMGVKLCTDRASARQAIEKRIGASRAVLYAARGMGSAQVPVPPTVLSKVYWSVAIPKMTYGLEICPLVSSDINDLESAHCANAKIVQWAPQKLPNPAPLATLGWLSLGSYLDVQRMMFMWRTLCLPVNNVYRSVLLSNLKKLIGDGTPPQKRITPVSMMYDTIKKYGLEEMLESFIERDQFESVEHMRRITKDVVWKSEQVRWRASCLLYRELFVYRESVKGIKIHPWWILVAKKPSLMPIVSSVMALLMGEQPRGMQQNIGKARCTICQTGPDKPYHVLFECKALDNKRGLLLSRMVRCMPSGMTKDYQEMNNEHKASFLISCLQCTYVNDWQALLENIAKFVHTMYAERKIKYDMIAE